MKRRITLGFSLCHLLLSGSSHAQPDKLALAKMTTRFNQNLEQQHHRLAPAYPRLRDSHDQQLQQALEQGLSELKLGAVSQRQRLSVALVDITDPDYPRLAEVNGDTMFYAASLPKIAILWGAFQRIADGEMELNDETRQQLTRMIRKSSNQAATHMLNRVGKEYLAELLQSPPYRFYDPDQGGGLWVGKEYAKKGAWKRDPLHNISHGATALQVARFYYFLETGRLVSPFYSNSMKSILADSAINHKFVRGLRQNHPDAKIYRKSGSWRNAHADSALIERQGRRYIAVGLVDDPKGGEWLRQLIIKLDTIIFTTPSLARSSVDKPSKHV
jgi:beta-lactamase class A